MAAGSSGRRLVVVVAAVVLAVAVGVGVSLLLPHGSGPPAPEAAPSPSASPSPMTSEQPTTVRRKKGCGTVAKPFAPRRISVPGVTRGAAVITPPRDANNVPGTPPVSNAGKVVFAWDTAQGTEPGGRHGNVLLNAHTWPDGTALGNHLLAGLHKGGRIIVHGAGSKELCYKVTEQVEVLASVGLPRYYDTKGPPQLAILVCSGQRLGPGEWTKRTVWFASPAA
jgi:hypothetical protein